MKSTENRRDLVEKPDLSVLGPIREIIRLAQEGKRSKPQLQAFVEGREAFDIKYPLNIEGAITILGEKKVITAEQACAIFNYGTLGTPHPICYSEEILRECAAMNRSRGDDWRLVYGLPLSFHDQFEIIGDDDEQPAFYANSWWKDVEEDFWSKSKPKSGYCLVNFSAYLKDAFRVGEKAFTALLGDHYEPTDERILSQALISLEKIHGERINPGKFHVGRLECSLGDAITIGYDSEEAGVKISPGGLLISDHSGDHYLSLTRKKV